MKILIVHPRLGWRGAEKLSVGLALSLQKHDHQVAYATLFVDPLHSPEGLDKLNLLLPSKFWQRLLMKNNFLLSIFGFWVLLILVFKHAKNFDILNPHNIPAPWIAVIVGKITSKPVVWTVHDISKKIPWEKKADILEYILWLIATSFLDRLFGNRVDEIITYSKGMAGQIQSRYRKRSNFVPPNINRIFFKSTPAASFLKEKLQGRYVLFSASQMHFRKNQIIAVRALSKILPKIANALLVLAGDGPDKDYLKTEVEKLGLKDKVIFPGVLSEGELGQLYKQADLFLLTSIEEPWGLTPFEALASGLISVVSDRTGAAEVIKRFKIGIIARPTAVDFARKILYAYNNRSKLNARIKRGRCWVKANMVPTRYAREHEKVFRAVVKHKHD